MFLNPTEVIKLAPIGMEILFVEQSGTKRLEWIAGSPFLNCLIVSLLKKSNYFNCQVNIERCWKVREKEVYTISWMITQIKQFSIVN